MPSSQLILIRASAGLVAAALTCVAVLATGLGAIIAAIGAVVAAIGVTREPVRMACRRVDLDVHATEPAWVVAGIAGLCAALAALYYDNSTHLVVLLVAIVGAIWAAWIDLRSKRIPSTIAYTASGTTLAASLVFDLPDLGLSRWATVVAIAAAGTAVLLAVAMLTGGRAVGAADVRLMPLLGTVAGYHGWETLWSTFIFAILLMFPVAVVSLVRRSKKPDASSSALPFAPGLVVGLALSLIITALNS